MVDSLITGGIIYTMDENRLIIQDGAVAIEGNTIVEVGTSDKLERYEADRIIDASNTVILPGFVDVHSHLPSIFVRGVYGIVSEGLYKVLFPIKKYIEPDHIYTFGLASCIEALNSGITTVQETYNHMDHFAKAAKETGIRANLGEQISEADYRKVMDDEYTYIPEQADEMYKRALKLVYEWEGGADGRITTCMAPLAPDMCTPDVYKKVAEKAEESNLMISTHLAQSEREVAQVKRLYGKTPVEHLKDIGILKDNLMAAHCIYVNRKDTEFINGSGTRILHCPRPYLLEGVTVPLAGWLEKGIKVGLGSDNVYHSMWETMRAALYAARFRRGQGEETSNISFYEFLELATVKGAELLGLGYEVGSLETGKKADIQIIDLNDPHITPTVDITSSLVLYGSSSSVKTVIVDGVTLKYDGVFISSDVGKHLRSAQDLCEEVWDGLFFDQPDLKRKIGRS